MRRTVRHLAITKKWLLASILQVHTRNYQSIISKSGVIATVVEHEKCDFARVCSFKNGNGFFGYLFYDVVICPPTISIWTRMDNNTGISMHKTLAVRKQVIRCLVFL